LAAAYGYGIVKNHPYRDGNKRAAFLTMVAFLGLNGFDLVVDEADIVGMMLRTAAGQSSESDLAKWIRSHIAELR